MYSMVLMAAMLPSGDAAGFGKRSNGCNGATAGCTGTVVAGCTGVPAGCTGNSCHGGGFLGHRDRDRNNCCGGGGFLGLRGKHKSKGCDGGCSGYVPAGCNGYVPAGCNGYVPAGGGVVVAPATTVTPEAMPKK